MKKTIEELLKGLSPKLNEGRYVFITLPQDQPDPENCIMKFVEEEGLTFIVEKNIADENKFQYEFVAAWITLEVKSPLDAIGLTAEFSKVLTAVGISCNVVAGFHHDHIFVNFEKSEKAMEVLINLSKL